MFDIEKDKAYRIRIDIVPFLSPSATDATRLAWNLR
jgi:hypothetical protein